jgi:hypothetical protein
LSALEEKDIQSDWEIFMKAVKIDPWRKNRLQKIALELRNDPKKVRVFANRLQSIISKAKSSDEVSDHHWEWYAILTLWPPLEVIRLLEDSSKSATRLRKTFPLLALFVGRRKSDVFALSEIN